MSLVGWWLLLFPSRVFSKGSWDGEKDEVGEGEYEMLEGDQICVVIVILLTLLLRLTRAVPESDSSTRSGH